MEKSLSQDSVKSHSLISVLNPNLGIIQKINMSNQKLSRPISQDILEQAAMLAVKYGRPKTEIIERCCAIVFQMEQEGKVVL